MALTIDQLQIQIEAESTQATQALDILISKLKTLQSRLNSVGTNGKNAGKGLQETAKGAEQAAKATEKQNKVTDKAAKSSKNWTDKLAQQITKTRTLYGAFKNAANIMAGFFKESNDYIETLNLFEVAMGDSAESAKQFAEVVQSKMGIDSKDWMNYQAIFQNLATGFGVAGNSASVMSQNLTQLSYDLASIYNTDVETAFDKLSSAMSGQVKGLREFGIDTTVATLQEYALSKGIDKSVRSMSQAEKSMLRYNYIMEQSRDLGYWNDMAKTIATPANALRILNAQITQMKRAFGNIVSVVVTQVIPYVQAFVELVTEGANKLAAVFGFELPDLNGKKLANDFGAAGDEVDDMADSLKKAKKQMMGFDELNIISNPDNDSSSSDSGGNSLGNMDLLEYNFFEGLKTEKLDEVKEKVKDILWYVGEVALGFLAWKLSKSFLGSLNGLVFAVGLTLVIDGIKEVLTDGLSWESVIKGAIGGALVGAAIGFKLGGAGGALLGASIGIGVTLLIEGISSMIKDGINVENVATTLGAAIAFVPGILKVIKLFNKNTVADVPELQTATDTIEKTSSGTSALTSKLKDFAKNMGWGLIILGEVAAAAIIFVGAIAILGWELDKVGKAWQPVIDNAGTVAIAVGMGAALLAAVGTATAALGKIGGGKLAAWMGIGIAILAEMGVATLLFVAEIWAIGKGLEQVGIAWQPVIDNGDTIKIGIKTGTALLVAIGVVTAALGAATVATAGALPLAIGLGTALLVELGVAFVEFVKQLVIVANQLSTKLHPALQNLNTKLPSLSESMKNFTSYMKEFAGHVVSYTKSSAIAGFSATVDSIIKFFTKDPIKSLADDANKQYGQAKNLNEKLRLANPELKTAIGLMGSYYTLLEEIERLTQKTNSISLASGMFTSMKEVGKNLVLGFVDGIKSQNKPLNSSVKSVLGDTFSSSVANSYGYDFGKNLGKAIARGFKDVSFPTLKGSIDVAGGSADVSLKLRAYAGGGVVDEGQMFIAREAGPELVGSIGRKTAVANNDQIIAGIESGVYRAMVAANSNGNSGGNQTIRIINEIDGDVVGEKVIKYHNSKVMQTGASPLLV